MAVVGISIAVDLCARLLFPSLTLVKTHNVVLIAIFFPLSHLNFFLRHAAGSQRYPAGEFQRDNRVFHLSIRGKQGRPDFPRARLVLVF